MVGDAGDRPRENGFVRYDYRVPGAVHERGGRSSYRLVLQHQPKIRPETLELTLQLPIGATNVRAPGWKRDGDLLRRIKPLEEDMELKVSWRS
jgi:hypothetical protein